MRKKRIWKWSSIALTTSILVLTGKEWTATFEKWAVLLFRKAHGFSKTDIHPRCKHKRAKTSYVLFSNLLELSSLYQSAVILSSIKHSHKKKYFEKSLIHCHLE